MREIKFRAWTGGKMIYPHEHNKKCGAYDQICYYPNSRNDENVVDFKIMNAEGGWSNEWDKQELMQYIGIKDVNGKDIYEGDIVHIDKDGQAWRVVYGYFGDAKFYVCNGINSGREIEDEDNEWVAFITQSRMFKLEVIGNIYENPELLK